jgi:hypothetical protein
VANNTTRGGERRTLSKAMGRWTTQQEARRDNAGQLDEAGVDDAGQLDSGQHKQRRGVEDLTGGGPNTVADVTLRGREQSTQRNAVADDKTINDSQVTVAKMA